MSVASRVAKGLSLVAGGGIRPANCLPSPPGDGERSRLPDAPPLRFAPAQPTLAELFAAAPRDGGWAGFLLANLAAAAATGPLLWVQDRMAILEGGRVHPPGLGRVGADLIHVEARDARTALWAMEEGLRCAGLAAVVGEVWGDPAALDFTATRRLAVAAERSGVPAWLIRLGGQASLSGARQRWRLASAPSLDHPFDPKAPGAPAWEAELFRARGTAPGQWTVSNDPRGLPVAAQPGDRSLAAGERTGERRRRA
jgi:protein ImuA